MGFDKEYVEQFQNMTNEEIENHIGLEKVRNVMEGYPVDFGIAKIRQLVKKIKEEQAKENKAKP